MTAGADAPLHGPELEAWQRAVAANAAERFAEAAGLVDELLRRHPAHDGLLQGRMQIAHNAYDSEGAFRAARALALQARGPAAQRRAWEVMLFWAPFVAGLSRDEIAELALRWSRYLAGGAGAGLPAPPPRPPGRRLRIGYLSPAFGFLADYLPLSQHDPAAVETFGYSSAAAAMSPQAAVPRFDAFRDLAGASDLEAAARIRQDDIDLLVDLGGTGDSQRNGILAHRPARLQLGWSNKLVPQFRPLLDWVLGDAELFGAGDFDLPEAARRHSLPQALCIVAETAAPPPPAPLPAAAAGSVTLGSTASIYKVTGPTLRLWSQVLHRVPQARLVYTTPRLPDILEAKLRQGLAAHGIGPERYELRVRRPSQFAAAMNEIDLALDALPFSSNYSCLQALRQGVPVVTCRGDRLAGRLAASLLRTIGRDELVAGDPDAFAAAAASLAADLARLQDYRTALPVAVARAGLNDLRLTAACLEEAYLRIWEASAGGASP